MKVRSLLCSRITIFMLVYAILINSLMIFKTKRIQTVVTKKLKGHWKYKFYNQEYYFFGIFFTSNLIRLKLLCAVLWFHTFFPIVVIESHKRSNLFSSFIIKSSWNLQINATTHLIGSLVKLINFYLYSLTTFVLVL